MVQQDVRHPALVSSSFDQFARIIEATPRSTKTFPIEQSQLLCYAGNHAGIQGWASALTTGPFILSTEVTHQLHISAQLIHVPCYRYHEVDSKLMKRWKGLHTFDIRQSMVGLCSCLTFEPQTRPARLYGSTWSLPITKSLTPHPCWFYSAPSSQSQYFKGASHYRLVPSFHQCS